MKTLSHKECYSKLYGKELYNLIYNPEVSTTEFKIKVRENQSGKFFCSLIDIAPSGSIVELPNGMITINNNISIVGKGKNKTTIKESKNENYQ